jgi:hypothetical protein
MTITDSPVDNGVNVQALLGAREALSAAPEAAQFTGVQLAGEIHRPGRPRTLPPRPAGAPHRASTYIHGAATDTDALARHLHSSLSSQCR